MKLRAKILVGVCWALLAAQAPGAARAASQIVPERLRTLAAEAGSEPCGRSRGATPTRAPTPRTIARLSVLGYREYDAGEFEAAAQDLQQATTPIIPGGLRRLLRRLGGVQGQQPGPSGSRAAGLCGEFPGEPTPRAGGGVAGSSSDRIPAAAGGGSALTAEPQVHQRANLSLILAKAYAAAGDSAQAAREFEQVYYGFRLRRRPSRRARRSRVCGRAWERNFPPHGRDRNGAAGIALQGVRGQGGAPGLRRTARFAAGQRPRGGMAARPGFAACCACGARAKRKGSFPRLSRRRP